MFKDISSRKLKLISRMEKLANVLKVKRFEDGNAFITIRNGYDVEKGKPRSCCIVINKQQIEELKEFLK